MKKVFFVGVGLLLLGMAEFSKDAFGYAEVNVSNGGTITGRVTLKGAIPPPRVFPLVLYPFGPFCKKISDGKGHVLLEEFIVDSGGGMQDTIVAVQQVTQGKPFPPIKTELFSVNCMFHPADVPDAEQFRVDEKGNLHHAHPLVEVLQNPQHISVVNKDPILHNGQVFQSEKGNIILNFPLPVSNAPRGGVVKLEPGKRITQMICGMHEFMQSWGFVVDNPYYAKTQRDGTFRVDQLPPGIYKIVAWHPHLKMIEKEITVPADGTVTIDFEFDSSQVKRPNYESQEKFRIGPEALSHQHLEGCEEPYCQGSE